MSERHFSDSADGSANCSAHQAAGVAQYGVSLLGPAVLTGVDTPENGGEGTRWVEDAVLLDAPSVQSRSLLAGSRAMMLLSAYPAGARSVTEPATDAGLGEATEPGAETGIVVSLRMWSADSRAGSAPDLAWDSGSNAGVKDRFGSVGVVSEQAQTQAAQYLAEVAELAAASIDTPSARAATVVREPLEEALTLLGQDPKWASIALGLTQVDGVRVVEALDESEHERASREALSQARASVATTGRNRPVTAPGAGTWRSRYPVAAIMLSILWVVLAVACLVLRPFSIGAANFIVAFVLGLDAVAGLIAAVSGIKVKRQRAQRGSQGNQGQDGTLRKDHQQ